MRDKRKEARHLALADNPMMAATRFGVGARPGEIEAARKDPRGFLKSQIRRSGADQPAMARDRDPSAPWRGWSGVLVLKFA